jgi:hypothetical protein
MDNREMLSLLYEGLSRKKKAINMYQNLSDQATGAKVQEMVRETLASEERHMELLSSLVDSLSGEVNAARVAAPVTTRPPSRTSSPPGAHRGYGLTASESAQYRQALEKVEASFSRVLSAWGRSRFYTHYQAVGVMDLALLDLRNQIAALTTNR